ncbi:MAG TPA: sulfatase-like hydrolase/transferase [Pirellulaceae bacterium]|jgi:uncharacterized sulfatase|nr:sulfatase-like hydrolase/transferase [Pirellulaceae bacterium]
MPCSLRATLRTFARFAALACLVFFAASSLAAADRPNILWLTSEDNGPHLGVYGDEYATTPNLDSLAARGSIYLACWSNAPVCAPARTTIISGMYPPSTGAEHMRSQVSLPEGFQTYPTLLREAGYYCTNNSKTDYNLELGRIWDDSSGKAHWKNRPADSPFFAVFNVTTTHESQIRMRPHQAVHDPAGVRVPAYHPDIPEVRQDWAQYYDKITEMDAEMGRRLAELEEAGLADDTIVFYYGDHGPGLPRGKRSPLDSGLRVPLIVHVPQKYRDLAPADWQIGGKRRELVAFVDFAPTVLSLAGARIPRYMQGRAFLGTEIAPPSDYLFGFRGRMDERYDLARSLRDERYVYVRNFMPHLPWGQHNEYMFITPTTQAWHRLHEQGKLTPEQDLFWQPKQTEELYDLHADPDEVRNLAGSPAHREILERMRSALFDKLLAMRDVGFLPEQEMLDRSQGSTPYQMGHDEAKYPLEKILRTADLASQRDPKNSVALHDALEDEDSGVRYWGTMGLLMLESDAVAEAESALMKRLGDESPSVRVPAAEALVRFGAAPAREAGLAALQEVAERGSAYYASVLALDAIDRLGPLAEPILEEVRAIKPPKNPPARSGEYVERLLAKLRSN